MNKNELLLILEEGEGYKIEFKESLTNIDREIVAFANSSGGRIFLGITDEGKIKGIQITNKLRSQIQDIVNNCRPKIKIIFEEFDSVLVINVREGEDKPYECSSGFFKRLGANSQKMARNEIIESFKAKGKTRFDELTEPKFKYPEDLDKNKLMRFLELADLSKSIKPESILTNIGIAVKQDRRLYFNIENVWAKPKTFIVGKTVFRRNHLIAELFSRIRFGEKLGSGMLRMKDICRTENAPSPQVEFNENYFYVTFRQSHEYLKLAKEETTQKTTQKILSAIKGKPGITRDELAALLGITPNGVKCHLDNLKKKGVIKRIGGRREGVWEISRKADD